MRPLLPMTGGLSERREVSYAAGEHAERYRRIMRVFARSPSPPP